MKEFWKGFKALIGALIVTCIYLPFGVIYSLGYGIWLKKRGNRWTAVTRFLWRLIDGTLAAIGYFFMWGVGMFLDYVWNVFGELIEDIITHEDNTTFGEKNITVSASVGKLEIDGKLNKVGRWFSRLLNKAFGQRSHAVGAWKWTQKKKELEVLYFNPIKK